MQYGVLGPLQVFRDGRDVTPRGQRTRDVLAVLLLRRGQAVDPLVLLDLVWGDEAVGLDAAVVHTVIARLRRTLGPDAIETSASGYRLGAVFVDEEAFAALVAPARNADSTASVELLREALGLWRSVPAYGEVSDHLVSIERARLHEMRHMTRENLADALLRTDTPEAAGEALALAESLVAEEPLRERAYELIMLAAYRCGRQADALAAHERLRQLLRDELGLVPGPAATRLQAQILAHDPALALAPDRQQAVESPLSAPAAPTTPLVGRAAELAAVLGALDERRLVTVHGPGGVGKSRLLAEVYWQIREAKPVGYLDLASIAEVDATELAEAIARALGLTVGPTDPVASLCTTLANRDLTLFLDEAEWAVEAVANVVSRVIRSCPGVAIVVSSRRPLEVSGERRFALHPLAVPPPDAGVPATQGSPAVLLLAERLADHAPGLPLRDVDILGLGELARRVDGLPLALELVAGYAGSRTVADLVDLLDSPLELRTSEPDRPARHRSLRETILWSADRLPDESRQVLRPLGVFVGGFDLDAARAVAGPGHGDVGAVCRNLAREALVQVQRQLDGELVWRLLRPVRDLALEGLEETGELRAARTRHRHWYAARWRGALRSDGLINDVRRHYDDYMEALRGALTERDSSAVADLVLTLGRLWLFTDALGPGLRWFGRVLETDLLTDGERARILTFRASLSLHHSQQDARRDATRAIPILDAEQDYAWLAGAHLIHALDSTANGDREGALEHATQAVDAARNSTDERLADALGVLAIVQSSAGTEEATLETVAEAWALARGSGSVSAMASVVNNLCQALLELGRIDTAVGMLDSVQEKLGDAAPPMFLTHTLAWVSFASGHPRRSFGLFADAVAAMPDARADRWAAETYFGAGCALAGLGDHAPASVLLAGARELLGRVDSVLPDWILVFAAAAESGSAEASAQARAETRLVPTDELGARLAGLVLDVSGRSG